MEVYKKLELLNQNNAKKLQIAMYLLACSRKYIKYNSSGYLEQGIKVVKRFLKGHATWKQLHEYEYSLEAESFGVEYYRLGYIFYKIHPDKELKHDLMRVRLGEGLTHEEAKQYLELLLQFIVYVFEYSYRPIKSIKYFKRYEQFLCPVIFKKYFGNLG